MADEKKSHDEATLEEAKRPYEAPKVESVKLSREAAEALT